MNVELLRRLTAAPGIPGFERQVREVVREEIAPLVDAIRIDRLGNLIATKDGIGGPTILIAAHMDEIGFLVRHVDRRGFLRLQPLGSFDPRVLVAQRVIVHAQDGQRITGVIETTAEPLHFGPPHDSRRPRLEYLFVDVGGAAAQIEIGDMVTLDRDMLSTGDRLVSRALDDRLGLYVMIEATRRITDHASTIVAVATVQEEVGSRGAVVAGYDINPDICIALDLTVANDIPGSRDDEEVTRLGQGPAIKVMDTTQISHPGIAVVTLSIPARYIHTVNETVAVCDVDHTVTLLAKYLEDAHSREYAAD